MTWLEHFKEQAVDVFVTTCVSQGQGERGGAMSIDKS